PDERFPRCFDFVRALWGNVPTESVPARPASQEADQANCLTPPQTPAETPTRSAARERELESVDTPTRNASAAPGTENAHWIRVHELADPKPEERPGPAALAPQVQRDGVLFPALVIGLGQTGMAVLQRLRESFHETLGAIDALPNIRWLYVDTDPA